MEPTNYLYSTLQSAQAAGDKVCMFLVDSEPITYAALDRAAAQFAHALVSFGVGPGDRVAAQIEKSPTAIVMYLACVRAGAVFLPLNMAYTATEVAYFVGDAEPSLLVVDPSRLDSLRDLAALGNATAVMGVVTCDHHGNGTLRDRAFAQYDTFCDVERGPDDLAAMLYTSGTTGRSKGAMLTHGNLASNSMVLKDYWRFTEHDVLLHVLPIFHTHGLFVATNVMLMAGGSLIFLPKFDPDQILELMPLATAMMGVPTFYVRLLGHRGLTLDATRHMRLFVSGSAPLLAETHREWNARTGHAILERYGMTETNMNTSNPYDGERIPGTVGYALPGVDVRVTHPDNAEVLGANEIGMIEVRGPNVFAGYWRNPEKTAAEFRPDGFFVTGDLGTIDDAGYVRIVGRGKDLIITGGYNVYPIEIEAEIDAIDGVVESAVIGLEHKDFGEGVAAVVVVSPGVGVTAASILAALDGRLARFKQPKRVFLVDSLPRNAMGKVQKNVLRDTYRGTFTSETGVA